MESSEVKRFASLYERHLKLLKLQGKSKSTIDSYSRAVRRIKGHYDCCPDQLTKDQLENYFSDLVESHSWSTVKIDRLGLMFFWKHVLELDWQWLDIVKPPKVKSIPDILTSTEIERLICATKKMRYRVFLLATYSMGLRLTEALSLEVGDIDGDCKLVHVRRGKGHKDRMVPLFPFPKRFKLICGGIFNGSEICTKPTWQMVLVMFSFLMLWRKNGKMPQRNGAGNTFFRVVGCLSIHATE